MTAIHSAARERVEGQVGRWWAVHGHPVLLERQLDVRVRNLTALRPKHGHGGWTIARDDRAFADAGRVVAVELARGDERRTLVMGPCECTRAKVGATHVEH